MSKSKIEWTEHVWNPVRGCSMARGSETGGCLNCYAARWQSGPYKHVSPTTGEPFAVMRDSGPRWTGKAELIESMLDIRWRRRKPTTYFVNSMSDLFHEALPDEAIDRVFAVMALCPQHTFQVLTKRAERMQKYADKASAGAFLDRCAGEKYLASYPQHKRTAWPLPNVWLGVSCEDQKTADERIPLLLQTPAAVRFVSLEPLLGAISLRWMSAWPGSPHGAALKPTGDTNHLDGLRLLDWVIAGGESGPGARPMHPDWVRGIRDQCVAAKVPFFFKQWGEYGPTYRSAYAPASSREPKSAYPWGGGIYSPRLGKRAASHLLDGREYRQLPKGLTHV